MFCPLNEDDLDLSPTGKFLRIMADEEHPLDRHCKCGQIILCPWSLACEQCDPESLPGMLREQAA